MIMVRSGGFACGVVTRALITANHQRAARRRPNEIHRKPLDGQDPRIRR